MTGYVVLGIELGSSCTSGNNLPVQLCSWPKFVESLKLVRIFLALVRSQVRDLRSQRAQLSHNCPLIVLSLAAFSLLGCNCSLFRAGDWIKAKSLLSG